MAQKVPILLKNWKNPSLDNGPQPLKARRIFLHLDRQIRSLTVAARNEGCPPGPAPGCGVPRLGTFARVEGRTLGPFEGQHGLALQRGSALLAVLWLSAALAAIAFALSNTVRSETDRASTSVDGLRSYYLAAGSIERASLELLWGATNPARRKILPGAMAVNYTFPSGEARVEIIPETAKLDVNLAPPEELYRLLVAMGIEPERARQITLAIVDWRTPLGAGDSGAFDQYYLSLTPSFRARHASFGEIEELLLVQGVTPEIFYGAYVPAADAGNAGEGSANRQRLVRREGLADCLSVFGARGQVDMNTAPLAVLAAVGVPPGAIDAILTRRQSGPVPQADFFQFAQAIGAPANRLRVGGESTVTLRATARLRMPDGKLSDLKRTVAALVKYMRPGADAPFHILRWYDTAWSN